jgi:uncharacterized protein (DUF362 family)
MSDVGKPKARVAIVKISSGPSPEQIKEQLGQLFGLLGGLRNLIPPSVKRVLVKPAIAFPEVPETGMSTHPWLAGLVAKAIQDLGLDVYIGESGGCGTGNSTQKHFRVNGLAAVAKELKIPLRDFKQEETIEVKVPGGVIVTNYFIAKAVMEADFRVSVPVIKTHCEATMTLSMKNMKGSLPSDELKARMHVLGLNSHLVDLNTIIKPHLSVADGIVGLMGYGPGRPGIAMNLGLLIGGTEALAVDATCARVCTYEPYDIEHLRLAEERGLGSARASDIAIVGERLQDVVYRNFVRPPKRVEDISEFEHVKLISEGGCSSCIGEAAYVLRAWAPREKLEKGKPITIVMGQNADPSKDYGPNVVAMGKCTRNLKDKEGVSHVAGCPPEIRRLMDSIQKRLGYSDEPSWKPPFADH